jgi:tetratricopeptide (TPR) repeat protein
MIQKCDQEIAKIEQEKIRKRNYDDAIKNADEKFNKNNWEDAIAFYQQALTFIPNDKYATDQIDACNAKIQERDLKNKSDANWAKYKEVMNNADIKFKSKDYIGAKSLYQQASGLEPNEELPKDRIKQCDELMKQKPVDNGYSVPVDLSARKKRYDKLRAQYGLGHTQLPETTEQNKKINTLINITDNPENADVYVKINWNTGLVFYYKNDVQISQSDYDNAVQQILQQ